MKNIYTLLLIMVSAFGFAQTNGITYQAVILNPQGEQLPGQNNSRAPLSNQSVCLRFEIKNSGNQLEYQETITTTTDAYGMVNLVIGTGNKTGGSAANFNALIWSASAKTLVVGLSTSGSCSTFIEISNQNFTGVPYAFATKTAENVTGVVAIANGGTGAATAAGAKVNLGLNNVDNTSDANKPISSATQTALGLKVDKVTGKSLVSDSEIVRLATITNSDTNKAYVDAQAVLKVDKVTGKSLVSDSEIVRLATITNSDTNKAYVDSQAALKVDKVTGKSLVLDTEIVRLGTLANVDISGKANIASPTFTGTVGGITKTMIGLGNIDNISDLNKPISTATQSGLDLKANLASPTFIGTPLTPTAVEGTNTSQIATTAFVTSAVNTATAGAFVDLTTVQIIAGAKTFSSDAKINGITVGAGGGTAENIVYNTAIGLDALVNNTGWGNTAIGRSTLTVNANSNNTAVGWKALELNVNGSFLVAVGSKALASNTDGNVNTALGANSLTNNTVGSQNVAIGDRALSSNVSGNQNTALGVSADVSAGNLTNATAIGYNAKVTASNTIQLGNTAVTSVNTSGTLTTGAITIPNTDGVAGQVLGTNGSGIVSWINPSTSGLVDITTDQIISGSKSLNNNLRVGTTTPTPSAVLEVSSTTQGFLPPRMTQTERNSVSSPVAGLIVWCKNCGENGELQVFNGTKWTNFIGNDVQLQLEKGSNFRGGKIAYVFQSGDPGFVSGEFHGIIVSDSDLSNGIRWGQNNDGLSTTYDCTNRHGSSGFALPCAIGAGSTNTALIIASNTESSPTNYAAKICADYSTTVNGTLYDDWFLPSYDEMLKIYQNKSSIGGLYYDSTNSANKSNWYWTSTGDVFQDRAADVNSLNGSKARNFRGSLLSVRAARYF
jgi:hypothetical protein